MDDENNYITRKKVKQMFDKLNNEYIVNNINQSLWIDDINKNILKNYNIDIYGFFYYITHYYCVFFISYWRRF